MLGYWILSEKCTRALSRTQTQAHTKNTYNALAKREKLKLEAADINHFVLGCEPRKLLFGLQLWWFWEGANVEALASRRGGSLQRFVLC